MLKRKFYDTLLRWKQEKRRECLLVNGARQVGKTYIIEHFGKTAYKSYLYLNFVKNPEYKSIFEGTLDAEEIYRRISLYLGNARYYEHDTLIFLDEIQVCRAARTALKFLALDDRYDVIASGSLLGIRYDAEEDEREEYSIPVGYEREVEMYSLDLEEYLWARGVSEEAIDILRGHFERTEKLDAGVNERYLKLLREYLVVGGMPEVVSVFLETNHYGAVYRCQQKILRAYENDIEKYARNTDKPKIRDIYYSLPRQLAKEYTKFQYKTVERNGSARKYGNALDWLIDAGLVKAVRNVALPELPLAAYEKTEEFKIYASDIGLVCAMYGTETQMALAENRLTGPAKGGIYENLIFDILMKRGKRLWYYKRENSTQEIEFLYEAEGGVCPVEVKSARGETPSLVEYEKRYTPRRSYKLTAGNLGEAGCRATLPQYMAMFL